MEDSGTTRDGTAMKIGLLAVPLVMSCLGIVACGEVGSKTEDAQRDKQTSTALAPGYQVRDNDDDYDNAHGTATRYDLDDNPTLDFGHLADVADAAAITELVKRYYAAAAAENGAAGCHMLLPAMAESLPEEYATPSGGESANGSTCAVVLTKAFKRQHARYVSRNASLLVTSVRVEGVQGLALMQFKGILDAHLRVRHYGGEWTVRQLIDEGLP